MEKTPKNGDRNMGTSASFKMIYEVENSSADKLGSEGSPTIIGFLRGLLAGKIRRNSTSIIRSPIIS